MSDHLDELSELMTITVDLDASRLGDPADGLEARLACYHDAVFPARLALLIEICRSVFDNGLHSRAKTGVASRTMGR